jgi:hypothetical protein
VRSDRRIVDAAERTQATHVCVVPSFRRIATSGQTYHVAGRRPREAVTARGRRTACASCGLATPSAGDGGFSRSGAAYSAVEVRYRFVGGRTNGVLCDRTHR